MAVGQRQRERERAICASPLCVCWQYSSLQPTNHSYGMPFSSSRCRERRRFPVSHFGVEVVPCVRVVIYTYIQTQLLLHTKEGAVHTTAVSVVRFFSSVVPPRSKEAIHRNSYSHKKKLFVQGWTWSPGSFLVWTQSISMILRDNTQASANSKFPDDHQLSACSQYNRVAVVDSAVRSQ